MILDTSASSLKVARSLGGSPFLRALNTELDELLPERASVARKFARCAALVAFDLAGVLRDVGSSSCLIRVSHTVRVRPRPESQRSLSQRSLRSFQEPPRASRSGRIGKSPSRAWVEELRRRAQSGARRMPTRRMPTRRWHRGGCWGRRWLEVVGVRSRHHIVRAAKV